MVCADLGVRDHQDAGQSTFFERDQQRAGSYGLEGWGFESLRARQVTGPYPLLEGPYC
jgi:hypothetical protein